MRIITSRPSCQTHNHKRAHLTVFLLLGLASVLFNTNTARGVGMYWPDYSSMYLWRDDVFTLVNPTLFPTAVENLADPNRMSMIPIGGTSESIFLRDGGVRVIGSAYGWAEFQLRESPSAVRVYEWGTVSGPQALGPWLPPSPDVFPTNETFTTDKFPATTPYGYSYWAFGFTKLVPASGVWEPGIYSYTQYACGGDPLGSVAKFGVSGHFQIVDAPPSVPVPLPNALSAGLTILGILGLTRVFRRRSPTAL